MAVSPLRKGNTTPAMLLEKNLPDLAALQEIFIVGFTAEGSHRIYLLGTPERLALVGLMFQNLALDHLRDCTSPEVS